MAFHAAPTKLGLLRQQRIQRLDVPVKIARPRRVRGSINFYPKPMGSVDRRPPGEISSSDSSAGESLCQTRSHGFEKIESDSIDGTVELVPPGPLSRRPNDAEW